MELPHSDYQGRQSKDQREIVFLDQLLGFESNLDNGASASADDSGDGMLRYKSRLVTPTSDETVSGFHWHISSHLAVSTEGKPKERHRSVHDLQTAGAAD